jgi:hypothetical protein
MTDDPRDQFGKSLHVHGAFKLERGTLTFRTADPALTQQLQADRIAGRTSTLLLGAEPYREFTGVLESVALVKVNRGVQWQVVLVEQIAKLRRP